MSLKSISSNQQDTTSHDEHEEDFDTSLIRKFIPNFLTLVGLLCGLTAIQMSFHDRMETAVLFILAAAILDALDGAMARLLKANTEFGAQLDSLSDFLCFGVAPAFLLYMWGLEEAGRLGWIATLTFPAAAAIRLARYNAIDIKKKKTASRWRSKFFSGVPAPAGAGLALFPIFVWFQAQSTFAEFNVGLPLIAIWVMAVAMLMVSRIPSWSTKQLKLTPKFFIPMLTAGGLLLAVLIHAPWITLSVISVIYMASLPFAFQAYRKMEKAHEEKQTDLSDLAFGAFDED